ncbi:hypothetical protein pb186bvf_002288 [Paramecium bursaria]
MNKGKLQQDQSVSKVYKLVIHSNTRLFIQNSKQQYREEVEKGGFKKNQNCRKMSINEQDFKKLTKKQCMNLQMILIECESLQGQQNGLVKNYTTQGKSITICSQNKINKFSEFINYGQALLIQNIIFNVRQSLQSFCFIFKEYLQIEKNLVFVSGIQIIEENLNNSKGAISRLFIQYHTLLRQSERITQEIKHNINKEEIQVFQIAKYYLTDSYLLCDLFQYIFYMSRSTDFTMSQPLIGSQNYNNILYQIH